MSSRPRYYVRSDFEDRFSVWKRIGVVVVLFAIVGIFSLAWFGGDLKVWDGQATDWAWWQVGLALPVVGLAVVVVQGIGEGALMLLAWPLHWRREDESSWRRAAFLVYVAAVVATCLYAIYWAFNPAIH